MKKGLLLITCALLLGGWTTRPAFNRVKSIQVYTNASKTIGTYYTPYVPGFSSTLSSPGASTQSLVLQGLANQGYSHIMVLNNTGASLSLLNTDVDNPYVLPIANVNSADSGNVASTQLFVLANGTAAWDDISVFDNLYVRSNGTSVVSLGNIDIMVW